MINFLIPLQSPEASKNWKQVSNFCLQTINSIVKQSDNNWKIFLVCNVKPDNIQVSEKICVIEDSFKIPLSPKERMEDKWIKVNRGLLEIKKEGPGYCMITDADDLIHKDFVYTINSYPIKNGFVVKNGLIWDTNSFFIHRVDNFNVICGTSSVIFLEEKMYPIDRNDFSSLIIKSGHTMIEENMKAINKETTVFPYRGVIYRASSGENDSGIRYFPIKSKKEFLRRLFKIKFLTKKIKENFNITNGSKIN